MRTAVVTPGDFLQAELTTRSGGAFEAETEFLEELVTRLMERYEHQSETTLLVLAGPLERPERNRRYYRHLMPSSCTPNQAFLTLASETLALWIEEKLDNVLVAVGNPPLSNDPAYDTLSVLNTDTGEPLLRLTQVKATPDNLGANCGVALQKFERTEAGDYDAALLGRLRDLELKGQLPAGVKARDLLYASDRRYRITAMHRQSPAAIRILTTYSEKIPGSEQRRSARLVPIGNWANFWGQLAEIMYARLT